MVDKNLFLYNLAVVAIFKNEAPYFKEWLDYHLLAGVEHFYLYNNDSSDNYKEVLAPYVEKNLVTLTEWSGKMMQYLAYNDAIDKYRFDCRYMAFIDLDEFIFPKTNQSIVEVVDEILSNIPNAAGLVINWQYFGSNGQDKADYSRGILERFTRRAPNDWIFINEEGYKLGNNQIKTIANPRLIRYIFHPHYAQYFNGTFSVNSDNKCVQNWNSEPILSDKIVVNHYYVKSFEEFSIKVKRGSACTSFNSKKMEFFNRYDRNEVFDDGILKYRAARAENFSFENDEQRANRVINALVRTLTQNPSEVPAEFFNGKLETFLTCRAVAEKFQIKIGKDSAEEIALAWIYRTLIKANPLKHLETRQFIKALPEILARPFSVCKDIKQLFQNSLLPIFDEILRADFNNWREHYELNYLQKLLNLIK